MLSSRPLAAERRNDFLTLSPIGFFQKHFFGSFGGQKNLVLRASHWKRFPPAVAKKKNVTKISVPSAPGHYSGFFLTPREGVWPKKSEKKHRSPPGSTNDKAAYKFERHQRRHVGWFGHNSPPPASFKGRREILKKKFHVQEYQKKPKILQPDLWGVFCIGGGLGTYNRTVFFWMTKKMCPAEIRDAGGRGGAGEGGGSK